MKVSIIGGGGRVGSTAAYALQLGGLARELVLVDVAVDLAAGEALDMMHGISLSASQRIYSGGYDAVDGSDIVLITAGRRRRPGESRLELADGNVALFLEILRNLKKVTLPEKALIIVVSNPIDILTMFAVQSGIVPPHRVIGLGTLLDTTRFRSLLGNYFEVDPVSVNALILGEHGDSMVPIWSTANIGGVPLPSFPKYDKAKLEEVFQSTRKSGAELVRLKGGAGYAVGLAIRELLNAVILDRKAVLPVSGLISGAFGIEDICLSLPMIVGRCGIMQIVEITANKEELGAIQNSAAVLKDTLAVIQKKV